MADSSKRIIDRILIDEGWPAFTDHPADRGGPTKGGITIKTLHRWRGRPVTVAELKALEEPEARQIYRQRFITEPRFDRILFLPLRHNVIDAGVLHGPAWAARRLQEIAGVPVDGILGGVTLGALNRAVEQLLAGGASDNSIDLVMDIGRRLNDRFTARRVKKVVDIVKRDPTQLVWLRGWINRALKFLDPETER